MSVNLSPLLHAIQHVNLMPKTPDQDKLAEDNAIYATSLV